MSLPTHDPNGRPLSDKARAELMALPEHLRCHPAAVAAANAPLDDRPEEVLRAEAARVAECDPNGPWIKLSGAAVRELVALREREEDAAE